MTSNASGTRVIVSDKARPVIQRLRIDVRRGPDKGLTLEIDAEPIRIGSSPGCDVCLQDAAVSGVHAELSRTPHGLLIRDLGSTNGTFVDKRRVQGVYAEGTIDLQLGESELRMTLLKDQSPIELAADDRYGDLIGLSVPMRALFAKLKRVAQTDATVLITGETGTGKELAAAAIRDNSRRKDGPFVVVDCGAMPANLIESELFGHERGAFTGAERSRIGAFERADGGTIFLDEIGELPLALQPSLLGILERREARRVGGQKPISVDLRVVTATNRDLAQEVARGAFRSDLYYRLAVVEMRLPPLRERPEDIPRLIEHFLAQMPGERPHLSPAMIEQLCAYPWPGNVRELRNVIERAALMAEAPVLNNAATRNKPTPAVVVDIGRPFKELKQELVSGFEESYVRRLIDSTQGNIAAAARQAGIDRMYLYKLLDRYGIEAKGR
ncbi:MAG: sigma 54-interacting transcriptional regulator [Myxococcota bacterium]